jgi:DNA polymerase I-like protein with 3'-5' exonuclease and polymerase domains
MQVHDELVLEVPDDELPRVRVELPPLMTAGRQAARTARRRRRRRRQLG